MTWTTPANVLSRWLGANAPSESSPVLIELIADAEDEVLRHYPRIQSRIDANELPIRRVQKVVSDVVQRAYQLAGDYRLGFSEAVGPMSHSSTFGADTPRVVRLTAEEIEVLAPVVTETYSLNMWPGAVGTTYGYISPFEDWDVTP